MTMVQTNPVVLSNHGYGVLDRMHTFAAKEKEPVQPGMYGWLFPELPAMKADRKHLEALGGAMVETAVQSTDTALDSKIPAGFTFLGQFVDHDLTFDTTPLPERSEDPTATTNFRTPALDLDCLYGNGPAAHPFLYERDGKFVIGKNEVSAGSEHTVDNDLPRNRYGVAIIADPRNDENLIVAQLHLAMMKFHNRVVELHPHLSFEHVRERVTLHYQWIVLHDFLPRVLDPAVLDDVLNHGPLFYRPGAFPREFAFIPVEFSAAAYRFGHATVREIYHYNTNFERAQLSQLFSFTGQGGRVPVPSNWVIEWPLFFFNRTPAPAQKCNYSRKINTLLAQQLGALPSPSMNHSPNLAIRNLIRGDAFGLPSGQRVAERMEGMRLRADVLTARDIEKAGDDGSTAAGLGFDAETPLWYYILKEAQLRGEGQHLGPVGSRIIAEVVVGLLKRPGGLLHEEHETFRPEFGSPDGKFTMLDLLDFAGELDRER